MLDRLTHRLWLQQAAKGMPPDPADVISLQYGRRAPWHWRRYFFPWLRKIGVDRSKKHLAVRRVCRGGGKTMFIAFAHLYLAEYVIPFVPGLGPENRRTIVIGRNETLTRQDHMELILQLMATGAPWLKTDDESLWHEPERVKGLKIPSGTRTWNTMEFSLANGVQILGFGWEQSIRGKHGYFVTPDDFVTEDNWHRATSPPGKSHIDEIRGAMMPAFEFGGGLLVTGTTQSESDAYQVLTDDPAWEAMDLPAYDEDGTLGYKDANEADVKAGLLDPGLFTKPEDWHCLAVWRYNYDQLEDARGKTRSSRSLYDREFLLKPVTDNTLLIHPNDMARAKDASLCYPDSGVGAFYAGLDPSGLRRDEAGIVVLRRLPDGRVAPVCLVRVKRRDRGETDESALERLYNEITRVHRKFRPAWYVEDNGFQWAIKPALADRLLGLSMKGKQLGSNKHMESVGWPMIRSVFESGQVALPVGPTVNEVAAGTPESDYEAVRLTADLCRQFNGIRLVAGKVIEEASVPNDLVSAFHLALLCLADAGIGESSVQSVAYRPAEKTRPRRPAGAEFRRPVSASGAMSRLADASRFARRL